MLGGLWHAFGAVQWSRGATYLTWTAKSDWNRLIGAYRKVTVPAPFTVIQSQPNFPWIRFVRPDLELFEFQDGDGLFGEEAQQFRGSGAVGFYRADGVSHNMSSNHPKAKEQFERAFNLLNSPYTNPEGEEIDEKFLVVIACLRYEYNCLRL